VRIAVARDLVTVGCELSHDLSMGPHVRPQYEERRPVAASGQQRADRRREARIGAVVEGERELGPVGPCAQDAPEQTRVRGERAAEVDDPEGEGETEQEAVAADHVVKRRSKTHDARRNASAGQPGCGSIHGLRRETAATF